MALTITPAAHDWYKEELGLTSGDSIRIFGKYGGSTNVHVGFSTGINMISPVDALSQTEVEGITYFTESSDEWFFANFGLLVDIDPILNEPFYTYQAL